jgi:sugar phosphate isomerase/epimerase
MTLSLSVRVAESFSSKEKAVMSLEEVARLAQKGGFNALCMRASQAGVHSSPEVIENGARMVAAAGLKTTMVTGDFNIVYNNEAGPECLRRITPYLELAEAFHAPLIRVALKKEEDIRWAQTASDEAGRRGLSLAHQCHTLSLFETLDGIVSTLKKINRPNFGLIYEPANLELCGQDYGPEAIRRLAPWIFNVYLQNQRLKPDGAITLETWARGPARSDLIPLQAQGGIDFIRVFSGLREIGYQGPITIHQAGGAGEDASTAAPAAAAFIRNCYA